MYQMIIPLSIVLFATTGLIKAGPLYQHVHEYGLGNGFGCEYLDAMEPKGFKQGTERNFSIDVILPRFRKCYTGSDELARGM